jgi:hypothetical protein
VVAVAVCVLLARSIRQKRKSTALKAEANGPVGLPQIESGTLKTEAGALEPLQTTLGLDTGPSPISDLGG